MEMAGRTLEEKELSDAMRENGLGTPATRASIIETLLQRKYVERSDKSLIATDKGVRLIELVHPDVKSPVLTGRWEARLQKIQHGREALSKFMAEIEANVRALVAQTLEAGPPTTPIPAASSPPSPALAAAPARPASCAFQAQQIGGIEAKDARLVLLRQPRVETDGIGLRHVEGVIGAQAQPIRAMRADQAFELILIEHKRIEPELAQIA